MSNIANRVKKVIIDTLGVYESEVTPEASFVKDLRIDSMEDIELVMEFEKEFNIEIPGKEAEKMLTVGDVIKYCEEHVK